ncbi:MAG: urease accessory protein UreF, partial [Alistipes sp.]|nr:urease accessory protein UreF [Alistipes sp.]
AEDELFTSLCYGTASMVLNAALRCMRITHLQTQRILFSLAPHIAPLYGEIAELDIDNMHSFSLQIDALSALHEKSAKRLFMN